MARSDERAAAVRTYSLAHNAERKTRDDAVDEFWSDFALEHATLLDSAAAGSSDSTPWQDHLEAEADATLTKLTDEKTPRENHGETISLNEKIYADELAARRFDLQHDRNVQAKADALAEHDELVTEQEDLTADDGYELKKLEYTAAPFEPTLDPESDLSGWEPGLQSDRHWAIQGYERYPGFVPVELMEQALTAGTQDEYGDFDFTSSCKVGAAQRNPPWVWVGGFRCAAPTLQILPSRGRHHPGNTDRPIDSLLNALAESVSVSGEAGFSESTVQSRRKRRYTLRRRV